MPQRIGSFIAVLLLGATSPLCGQSRTPASPADEAIGLLQQTARALESRSIEPEEEAAFRRLIAVAERLKSDRGVPADERNRLRGLARARLRQAAEVLRRRQPKERQVAALPDTVRLPASSTLAQAGLSGTAGGGNSLAAAVSPAQEAQRLIDLITAVIAPESWAPTGGTGVIRYWALGHALVVRTRAEEHDAVGDLAGQLRRAK